MSDKSNNGKIETSTKFQKVEQKPQEKNGYVEMEKSIEVNIQNANSIKPIKEINNQSNK